MKRAISKKNKKEMREYHNAKIFAEPDDTLILLKECKSGALKWVCFNGPLNSILEEEYYYFFGPDNMTIEVFPNNRNYYINDATIFGDPRYLINIEDY